MGLLNALQAASNTAADTVAAPVDGLAWLLRRMGVPVNNPVGGSDWMRQQGLTAQVQPGASKVAGETFGLLAPTVAVAKAPQIAAGLLKMGENAAKPATISRGMAGSQRGVFGGELAKTADKAALAKAKELEKAGTDARAIWSETGWFKGGDGKWRFEIDDSVSKWEPSFSQSPAATAINTAVGDALDHAALFKAYPSSSNTGLGMYPGAHNAMYQPAADKIIITRRGESGRGELLHELQHAIQQKEGFAKGGAPAGMRDEALRMLRRDVASGEIDDTARAMQMLPMYQENAYLRLAGEAEARAVESRMNLTPAQRRALFPLDSYDVPVKSLIYR